MATVTPVAGTPRPIGPLPAVKMMPRWHPSPNYGPRRGIERPDMVVLHYTAMHSAEAALERLCSPCHEVSAHYLIGEDGRLWQLVRETERAWHAGRGAWGAVVDVNSHSIGIELANTGRHPFPEPQMTALEHLLAGCLARWQIAPCRVIGHQDMAPTRKQDPGRRFDWRRLARRGLSVWPDIPSAPAAPCSDFTADAARFGYAQLQEPQALLAAFRRGSGPGQRVGWRPSTGR